MFNKPFSQACENNKQAILSVLQEAFANKKKVLEIASGTGQHAIFFSAELPTLIWQTSDLEGNHAGINSWLDEPLAAGQNNLLRPLVLDVTQSEWPQTQCDAIFSANSLHIMPWHAVLALFEHLKMYISEDALLAIYGPFNYGGQYTSESNQNFDEWLAQNSSHSAIRDFEAVNALAISAGLTLQNDFEMPANNRLLLWKKTTL